MFRNLFLSLAAILLLVTAAQAESGSFEGKWQQIGSNAGDCKTCKIEITKTGMSLNVTSNNGWAATFKKPKADSVKVVEGTGEWRSNSGGVYAGKLFLAHMEIRNARLYLKMMVRQNNGVISTVEANFQRSKALDI